MTMGWHPSPGRFALLGLAANFPRCVFEPGKAGELQQVRWESEWKNREGVPVAKLEVRRPQRRHVPKGSYVRGVADERIRRERRSRKRLACEICGTLFEDIRSLAAHACRANQELVREGLVDLIAGCRLLSGPLGSEVEFLRSIVVASLSEDAFLLVCKCGYFESAPDVQKEQHYQRYRAEWFFCFLALVRPDEINPKIPTRTDKREALRIEEAFFILPPGPQRKILYDLFNGDLPLEDIAGEGTTRALIPSPKTIQAILQTQKLRGLERAKRMDELGQEDLKPSAVEFWRGHPGRFRGRLFELLGAYKRH